MLVPDKDMELKKYDFHIGQRLFSNHYEFKVPGSLFQYKGKNDAKDIYYGGWIFAYHSSVFIYVLHQVALKKWEKIGKPHIW